LTLKQCVNNDIYTYNIVSNHWFVILLRYAWLSGILSAVGDIRSLMVKIKLREISDIYICILPAV